MSQGYWCYTCGKADDEPAGPKCHYPPWHIPGVPMGQTPPDPVRLPYVDDLEDADAQS